MMALIPVSCWKIWSMMAMTRGGLLRGRSRLRKGCFTSLAASLAARISSNSGSMFVVPRIRLRTDFPSSRRPLSIRLFGVSVTRKEPTVRSAAGTPARPRDKRQPHPGILGFNRCLNAAVR